jgi:hypothetical protein
MESTIPLIIIGLTLPSFPFLIEIIGLLSKFTMEDP